MPVPSFLASFADKAQSAINASPLAGHIHGVRPNSPDSAAQPSANDAAAQGASKSHALGAIQHQLRAFGQQYSSTTTPVQKIITVEKGIALDFDSVSRDSKSQSKELYTWGQTELEDLKDVTDRLAYLNFVQGSLASSLSLRLDAARAPLKALRDAETAIAPRRNVRAGLRNQLARVEHDQQKGAEKKIAELKDQIRKAELDDEAQEKEIELLKRKAVRESERLKWEAFREYGEKLVLLSQASTPIIAALPTLPPTPNQPYTGAQATGAARASLQRALDNYKTGHINLPPHPAGADLHRSDTRSFGESHASELSSMDSEAHSGLSTTPPHSHSSTPFKPAEVLAAATDKTASPPPINPAVLNQAPAPIPASPPSTLSLSPAAISTTSPPPVAPVPVTPTVAETGVPVSAGTEGPGPASGSLHDIRSASANAGPRGTDPNVPTYGQLPSGGSVGDPGTEQKYPSAEEEKRRLQAPSSQVTPPAAPQSSSGGASNPQYESAEDEKKRLEREERERLLRGDSSAGDSSKKDGDDELPPYRDI
ncbi:putative eisosome component PIL1 [Lyophyllum shimeji]|uniref:Eisosome component PIL1 n=1 Tax=Lyophyllum shimeji TaxID=47721 RepID=A0A9P3UIY2_LYOSH|nr:putative eisosome component PIL1 [Lyophyllum shimeji]